MRVLRRAGLGLVMAAVSAGCATTGGSGTSGRDFGVITAEEIAEVAPQVSNLYQVVERLRPRWLEARGPRSMSGGAEIMVYQGQSLLGTARELRQYGADYAYWLEYLDASEAVARLPGLRDRSVGGAIVLHLQPPRR